MPCHVLEEFCCSLSVASPPRWNHGDSIHRIDAITFALQCRGETGGVKEPLVKLLTPCQGSWRAGYLPVCIQHPVLANSVTSQLPNQDIPCTCARLAHFRRLSAFVPFTTYRPH
jgi:hypothetical protein